MRFLPLVWAGLWRRPLESLLTWLAVTAAFTLFALMAGINTTYERQIEAARPDRLIVVQRFMLPAKEGHGLSGLPIALGDRLAQLPGVAGAGAFASICGSHEDLRNLACVMFVSDGMRRGWPDLGVAAADWDLLAANLDGILVSHKASLRWHLKEGDVFTLTTPPGLRADGGNSVALRVLRIVGDSSRPLMGNIKYFWGVVSPSLQNIVGGFRVAVADAARTNEISRRIERQFANSGTPLLSISARAEEENADRSIIDIAVLTRLIGASGLVMILFLAANAIARSVRERGPEFAVLQAVGFTANEINVIVFAEVAIPTLLGAAVGTALGAAGAAVNARLIPANALSLPPATVTLGVLAVALGAAVVLALLCSVIPLLRLRRLDPAVVLRGQ